MIHVSALLSHHQAYTSRTIIINIIVVLTGSKLCFIILHIPRIQPLVKVTMGSGLNHDKSTIYRTSAIE